MSKLLKISFDNMLDTAIGEHGLPRQMLDDLLPKTSRAVEAVMARRGPTDLGFLELPHDRKTLESIRASWDAKRGRFTDVVVLGIGGSALGPLALKSALKHPCYDMQTTAARAGVPRLHVLDNVDPVRIAGLLDILPLDTTLFLVITKSGSTVETMSQFLLAWDRLEKAVGRDRIKDHMVCITDPEKGRLRQIAQQEGLETFDVPPAVGGRFSVLTPVGLYPAVALDLDCGSLLDGALAMDEKTRSSDVLQNPAALSAALLYLAITQRQTNIHVLMPYCHGLGTLAEWYAQLWAESLGKRTDRQGQVVNVGQTPVKAVGVTDQHSQVQLYVEGPYDKVITLIEVEKHGAEVEIPQVPDFAGMDGVDYIQGKHFGQLFDAERVGTELALKEAGRMNYTVRLPEVSAHTLGQMMYMLEMQTAVAGELFDINAFDQPGVEAGKINAYAMMGRKGFEARAKEIEEARAGGSNLEV